jgi:hypothetical protein
VAALRRLLIDFWETADHESETHVPINLSAVLFEMVEGHLTILADLDEVAVGIAHVTTPFPPVIVQRLGKKECSFVAPLLVAGPDVGDPQIKEAIHPVGIGRGFEEDLWLVGSRAAAGIENHPGVRQLDVAGILRLDHLAAKNSDVEVLRFLLVLHGEEVRSEEAFVCNWRIRQTHAVSPAVHKHK